MAVVQTEGTAVDRRHIELQIRAVVVTYRIEQPRRNAPTMQAFVARAAAILDGIDAEVQAHPDLAARLFEARQELSEVASSSAVEEEDPGPSHVPQAR